MMEDTGTQVSGEENEPECISESELYQIFFAIFPESEDIKAAFIRWVSLPELWKDAIEKRLDEAEASTQGSILSVRDAYVHKIYSMSKVLLQVFVEWDRIQDTYGAPGVESGYCCLTKRLETDIKYAVQYFQEQMESVVGEHGYKHHSSGTGQSILHRLRYKFGFGFLRGYGNSHGSTNYDPPGPRSCHLTERLLSTRSSLSDTVIPGSEALGIISRPEGFFINDPEKLRLDALLECQNSIQADQFQCCSPASSSSDYELSQSGATGSSSSEDEPNVSAMSETGSSEDDNEF